MDSAPGDSAGERKISFNFHDKLEETVRPKRSGTDASTESSISAEEDRLLLAQAQMRARSRSLNMQNSIQAQKLIDTLKNDLNLARDELSKRNQQCEQLTFMENKLRNEVEDLTQSLFEEANKMVEEAGLKQMGAEKELRSAKRRCEELTMQVETLKSALTAAQHGMTSTDESSNVVKSNWSALITAAKRKKDADVGKKEDANKQVDADAERRGTLPALSSVFRSQSIAGNEEDKPNTTGVGLLRNVVNRRSKNNVMRNSISGSDARISLPGSSNAAGNLQTRASETATGLRRFQSLFNRQRSSEGNAVQAQTQTQTQSQSIVQAVANKKNKLRASFMSLRSETVSNESAIEETTSQTDGKPASETADNASDNQPIDLVIEATQNLIIAHRVEQESDKVLDKRTFMEFSDWLQTPTLDEAASPFLSRVFNDDVKPCLMFTVFEREDAPDAPDASPNGVKNEAKSDETTAASEPARASVSGGSPSPKKVVHFCPTSFSSDEEEGGVRLRPAKELAPQPPRKTSDADTRVKRVTKCSTKFGQLLDSIKSNSISIVPCPTCSGADAQFCFLDDSRLEKVEYRVKLAEADSDAEGSTFYVCSYARQRLIAVCEFYTYLRYIERGIKKLSELTMFNEIARLRMKLCAAKLGLEL